MLILEDDFVFTVKKHQVVDLLKKIAPVSWDVVMFASVHKKLTDTSYPFLKRVIKGTTASGYIVRKHYYKTLLNNFRQAIVEMKNELLVHIDNCCKNNVPVTKLHVCSAIDQYWFSLQAKDIFYLIEPSIGEQDYELYSDNNCSPEYQKEQIKKSKQ